MANEAWRWFGVRGETLRPGPIGMLVGTGRRAALRLITLGLGGRGDTVTHACFIYLYRRDNSATVLRFDHGSFAEAKEHLSSLRARLDEMQIHDFCREVGIAVDWVTGPGTDERGEPASYWTRIDHAPPELW